MDFCWKGAWEGGHRLKSKTKHMGCLLSPAPRPDILPKQVALCERDGRPGPQPQRSPQKVVNPACKTCLSGSSGSCQSSPDPLFPGLVNNIPDGLQAMGVWDTVHWFKGWVIPQAGPIRSFPESLELEWRHTEAGGVCSWATAVSTLVPLTLWAR